MRHKTYFVLLLCWVFLCNHSEATPSQLISVEQTQTEDVLLKNAPSHITFTVKNTSAHYIVLRRFEVEQQLPEEERWYGAAYGSVAYRPLEDEYRYYAMHQQLSEPVFAFGVLPPGDEITIERWTVPQDKSVAVIITYQALSADETEKMLYVSSERAMYSGAFATFTHPKKRALEENDIDWSQVIFPDADQIPVISERHEVECAIAELGFSRAEAERIAGMSSEEALFWPAHNAWVLKKKDEVYYLTRAYHEPFPQMELDVITFCVSREKEVPCILPTEGYSAFNAILPTIEGPGYFNPGITQLKKEKVRTLFQHAYRHRDEVSLFSYDGDGLGRELYLLVGTFDEIKRRRQAEKGANKNL